MPRYHALAASGRNDEKRPQPLPRVIKAAIESMVYGKPGDADARPLELTEAARDAGIAALTLRRWADKPQGRAYLLATRRAFLSELLGSNPGALKRVRDESKNGMCVVASVRQIEEMAGADDAIRRNGPPQQAGVTVRIINNVQGSAAPAGPIVDVTPNRPAPD